MLRKVIVFIVCVIFPFVPSEAKRVVVHSVDDFQKNIADAETKYIVQEEIDLQGSHIFLAPYSKLIFKKGNLKNGIIDGNFTRIKRHKDRIIFRDCEIRGTWEVDHAYSNMFNEEMEAVLLLKNLSTISPYVKLSANREYHITARGESVLLNCLEAAGKDKPIISFHTIDPNVNGINIKGDNVVLRNLIVTDDYSPNNDARFGKNNLTNGSTIGILAANKDVYSLVIDGCDFIGGTSSSFVASSQTKQCLVKNCYFSGYMADHGVYCSMKVVSFTVNDCILKDIDNTTGVFKVRTSKDLQKFTLNGIKVYNLNGYLARISLLETPTVKMLFNKISVTKDIDNKSVFCGFCVTDETEALEGTGRFNAEELTVSNCYFGYGYKGESMLYPGSEKKINVRNIKYLNVIANESNFGGGISDNLYVKNCTFLECTDDHGILISSKHITIKKTNIYRSSHYKGKCLFLINYSKQPTSNISLKSVDMDLNVENIFIVEKGEPIEINIKKSELPKVSNSLFYVNNKNKIEYNIKKNKTGINCTYKEISYF